VSSTRRGDERCLLAQHGVIRERKLMELELHINGVVNDRNVATNESLLSLLRREGYSSVKNGCGTGECGACTVLIDGVPRPSCVTLAAQVGGCTISTVESLG